ncbi:hypothetical protein BVX94_00185, partial [bacterium B17]
MIITKRFVLSSLLIMCVLTSAVCAQDEADVWQFSASVIGEGTDNRDSSAEGVSNFDMFINLRLDLDMDFETSLLDLYYAPYYRYRSDPSDLQNDTELQHDLGVVARRDLKTVNLRLNERFSYTDDPSIQQTGSTLRRDSSYSLNNIMLGGRYLISQIMDIDLSVRNSIKRYDDDVRATQADEDSTSAELSLWRRIQTTVAGYLLAGTAMYSYDDTTIDRGFDSVYAGVGLEKSFSRELRGGVRAGYTAVSYNDDGLDDNDSPFVQASIVSAMSAVSRVTGIIGYSLRDSDIYPFSSQEATAFSIKWDWDTTPLITIGAFAMYRIGTYDLETVPDEITSATTISDGDESTIVLEGKVQYKFNEMTSIMFLQRYE